MSKEKTVKIRAEEEEEASWIETAKHGGFKDLSKWMRSIANREAEHCIMVERYLAIKAIINRTDNNVSGSTTEMIRVIINPPNRS